MLLRKKLDPSSSASASAAGAGGLTSPHRSVRADSDFAALDFASTRNDRRIVKAIDNEELLFSEVCTKTNHQGVRQRRLIVLTSEALYIFKKPTTYQKRIPLDLVECLILSMESVSHLVIRTSSSTSAASKGAAAASSASATGKQVILSALELAAQQLSQVSNNSVMLDMTRRNAFTKMLRQAKPVKKLKLCEVNHAVMERAFKDAHFTFAEMAETQRILSNNLVLASSGGAAALGGGAFSGDDDEEEEEGDVPQALKPSSSKPAAAATSLRKRVSLVLFSSPAATPSPPPPASPQKKQPPQQPTRKLTKQPDGTTVKALIRRASMLSGMDPDAASTTYFPRCPPCHVQLGVVQPIWSLLERALEPLVDLAGPAPASGLVRCADILHKLVGERGPQTELEAIKAVALLCFDKDAARALLRSLQINLPILGGSALVDSLDALQRCESVPVRGWAIKSLWRLLPMCMSEHALPTTSTKWMAALRPEDGEDSSDMDSGYVANEGEAWFLKTYFRGRIQLGVHEKEPLRRIAKRKASFSVLGGNYRNSANFPGGLTPLLVQQAFSQVLLQNMLDVQRRAAFAEKTLLQSRRDGHSTGSAADDGSSDAGLLVGVTEQDCVVVFELLLNSLSNPLVQERKVLEVTGKRIANTVILPTLMGMLGLLEEDSARQRLLKDVSLLLLRSETNLKAVLDIPGWQMLFVPLLQTIPRQEQERSQEQRTLYKYVLNLLTMIHTYCFKEPTCRGGPLGHMLNCTAHSLAVFAGWNGETAGVLRWVYLGLAMQLASTARMWWHDADAPEWTAFAQLVRSIEEFVFFHAYQQQVDDAAAVVPAIAQLQLESQPASKQSGASEDDYGSGDEDYDESATTSARQLGKRKKRQFSITPVYELKGFVPVVLPFSPRDAKRVAGDYDWLVTASALSAQTDGAGGASSASSAATKQQQHKSVRSKQPPQSDSAVSSSGGGSSSGATPSAAAYNANDKFRHFGLHLTGEKGTSQDLGVVECAVDLLKRMGITGNAPEDMRRADLLKHASKKQKSLLKSASEWCQTLQTIHQLLSDLGNSVDDSALKNTMSRIAQFVETRYDGGGRTVKLGVKQTKAVATKLEASVLKQRQLAKQQLQAKTQQHSAQLVAAPIVITSTSKSAAAAAVAPTALGGKASFATAAAGKASFATSAAAAAASGGVVGRVRFYSSVEPEDEDNIPPPPPPLPKLTLHQHPQSSSLGLGGVIASEAAAAAQQHKKQSVMIRHGISFDDDEEEDEGVDATLIPPPPPSATLAGNNSERLVCCACDNTVDEFDSVKHGNKFVFHSDCFTCEECRSPLLKTDRPEDNNLFFRSSSSSSTSTLRKFCGVECRMAHLGKHDDAANGGGDRMCPGCMSTFQAGDHALESCGRLWHVDHLNCQDCDRNLGRASSEPYFPVEVEQGVQWPFCAPCHDKRFKTCAKCNQGILPTDSTFHALGRVFHENHFNCFRCGDNFAGKHEFYVDGHGDQSRALCFKCWNDSNSPRICCDLCNLVLGDSDDCVELGGKTYHASRCFQCHVCKDALTEGEVFENPDTMLPMCDKCFYSKRGVECEACRKVILENPLLTDDGRYFHSQCFACQQCNGLVLTGRYFMDDKANRPVCEQHWQTNNGSAQCKQCQLPITSQQAKLTLNPASNYHVACLVCHYCQRPLAAEASSAAAGTPLALNMGPDDMYYCGEHADGVCPHPGCAKPCWADGKLRKIAGEFLCEQHYAKASEKYMEDACARCGNAIKEHEGLEILDRAFHYECFACTVCQRVFKDGEDFQTLPDSPQDAVHAHCM